MNKFKNDITMTSIIIYGLEKEQNILKKKINYIIHVFNQSHINEDEHGQKIKIPIIIKHNIRNNIIYVASVYGNPFSDIKEELVKNKDLYKSIIVNYLSISINKNNNYIVFHKKIDYNNISEKIEIIDIETSLKDYKKEFNIIFNKLNSKK